MGRRAGRPLRRNAKLPSTWVRKTAPKAHRNPVRNGRGAIDRRHRRELSTVSSDNDPNATLSPAIAALLKRGPGGLVPAIVQEHETREVLMLAWMNDEALNRTLTTGRATYWSRSRQELWVKGDTSGHHQYVRSVRLDCDGDTLLVTVEQVGVACHTGAPNCFVTKLENA
jgi:phosphoribosyl-AMP cyclohydrolase